MDNIGMRCIVGWRKSKNARDENKTHIETSITTRPNTTEYPRSVLVVASVPCSTKQSCEIKFQFVVTAHPGPSHPRHARRARWAGPKCGGAKKKKRGRGLPIGPYFAHHPHTKMQPSLPILGTTAFTQCLTRKCVRPTLFARTAEYNGGDLSSEVLGHGVRAVLDKQVSQTIMVLPHSLVQHNRPIFVVGFHVTLNEPRCGPFMV